ncbi:MAG: metal ABC transporter ATP-binding protein [Rhodospirillales bacterium CG15_BIG_FIL_POST_REV_8_21_14_020_66_15]|nr:MAG: metal ABC transporter ATP-binding protein [Rhodospirillales bacterium CG15_BIG_FIL_POST_REV_8_21_14_020_66_15]
MKSKIAIAATVLTLSACASQPNEISAQNISTLQYKDYDCDQLAMESDRIDRRIGELHGQLKKKADDDAVQMGVGLVLLWPTLFFLEGGDGPEAQEYGRLKGEKEAIETVAIHNKCGIAFKPLEEVAPSKPTTEANKG